MSFYAGEIQQRFDCASCDTERHRSQPRDDPRQGRKLVSWAPKNQSSPV